MMSRRQTAGQMTRVADVWRQSWETQAAFVRQHPVRPTSGILPSSRGRVVLGCRAVIESSCRLNHLGRTLQFVRRMTSR